ncbi:hypothetical protein ILFOPFJJ_06887 [Ensifer psoraleae]|uniref:ParB/RepB/Spo0J family partition protein n=1 Tax=Sinorhizobium psoraleae TaxID=520838 RepID=UPI00156A2BBA|nr:ParB N-terminal domain-containing protein [Sinorhizobium psoraleae]NRP75963.1 hypothetical protein [Sinorhizobium psoraleae]
MIPLNKLSRSPLNVRKTSTSEEEDNELYASVKTNGMKQNLLVHKSGNGYFVQAGGRRLAVLERLAPKVTSAPMLRSPASSRPRSRRKKPPSLKISSGRKC